MSNFNIYCEQYDFSALSKAFEDEVKSDVTLSLEIIFLSKEEIRSLNKEQRNIDNPTDVLSFPTLYGIFEKPINKADFPYDIDEDGNLFLGSIAICTDIAREQAEEYGHSYERELFYLATHGVCHLLGYDHMQDADKVKMREKEEKIMTKLNLTRN